MRGTRPRRGADDERLRHQRVRSRLRRLDGPKREHQRSACVLDVLQSRRSRSHPSLTESVQGTASTRRFDYDDAGRLTTVRDENDAVLASYAYDDNGNRSRVTRGGSTTLASCLGGGVANPLDQLCL
jgi:YD repeat-containing protein